MKLKLLFTLLAFLTLNNIIGAAREPWEVVGFRAGKEVDKIHQVRLTLRNPANRRQLGHTDVRVDLNNDDLLLRFTTGGYEARQTIKEGEELVLNINSFHCHITPRASTVLARLKKPMPRTIWGIEPPKDLCVVS